MTGLLVVAHDAGGAEVLCAHLRREPGTGTIDAVLGGPAVGVFERRLPGRVRRLEPFPELAGYDLVLCGSSGAADLERRAVRLARAEGVRSVVWLEHWVAYAPRFRGDDGELVLPDEVWVGDEHAERIAREELPAAALRRAGNPYLEDAAAEVLALRAAARGGGRMLYVTEPTTVAAERATGDPLGWGYDERDALARHLAGLVADPPGALRIRLHPAEPRDKYDAVLAARPAGMSATLTAGTTLAEDIAWADTVVGCDTMAMVVALLAGRRVLSVIPPGGRALTLPFAEIERR